MGAEEFYTSGTRPYFRAPHIYIAPATRYLRHDKKSNTRVILMTTRAGSETYDRTFGQEDFLLDPRGGNRSNYIAWGNGVQTGPKELSFYNVGTRYTLRLDGFGSLHAGEKEGQMVTTPFTFEGKELTLNFKTGDIGSLRVEILDSDRKPIPSFGLADCQTILGDEIDKTVAWEEGADLGAYSGKPVRLRFVMQNADVYSLRFR